MPEANTVSGSEGKVFRGSTELLCVRWVLTRGGTLDDITNSTSGGAMKRKKVKTGGSCTFDLLWDSTAEPEATGLDFGDEFTADLRIGGSARAYNAVPFIVESCVITGCSQENVVGFSVTAHVNGVIPDPAAWGH
jgi:hypothetical protein